MVKRGEDTWFFVTADYAFGMALERDAANVVKESGGKVLGQVRHPLNSSDFSSFLLQAQASKAKVIGLANAGAIPMVSLPGISGVKPQKSSAGNGLAISPRELRRPPITPYQPASSLLTTLAV